MDGPDSGSRRHAIPKTLTLEELQRCGWILDEGRGFKSGRVVSVGFDLVIDGHRLAEVNGIARTSNEALGEAVQQANAWVQRQDPGWLQKFAPELFGAVFSA